MKNLFGVLLLLSVGLFAFMQWGGLLTSSSKNALTLPELNADKIKLLDKPILKPVPGNASQAAQSPAPIAAPSAMSAPAPVVVTPPIVEQLPSHPPLARVEDKTSAFKSCMEWGEFSGTDLARATQVIADMKLADKLSKRQVVYTSGYWVYIKPFKTHAGVSRKVEQIKALGIDDYFIVKESGKWNNAISLGVFKTRQAANNHLLSLAKKGLHIAKIGARKRRLTFSVFVLTNIDANTRTQLTNIHKSFPDSALTITACK